MKLWKLLKTHRKSFGKVIDIPLRKKNYVVLDLSPENNELLHFDIGNPAELEKYICSKITQKKAVHAIGKYNERRIIYDHSPLFSGTMRRNIHIGLDVWLPAGTKVFCPMDGTVHSFQNNIGVGDYGPTIILQHILDGITFFTLYGHLSPNSLNGLSVGKKILQGNQIATLGNYPENGNWPPHLHFQIIGDMLGKKGDFWAVVASNDLQRYLELCPNPNLILQLNDLD